MAHILLVEDDDSVRAFTARALQIDGHTVDQADDGDIGLEKAAAKGGGSSENAHRSGFNR